MNKKHRSLSVKLLFVLPGVAVGVMAVATIFGLIFLKVENEEIRLGAVYIGGLVFIIVALVLCIYIINLLVVKRIKALNVAVSEISQGKYDLTVPVKGNDKLTELAENFNKMTKELQANAFLSKDFARYVSHEFKTPLSVIRSYAEAVQMNNEDKETGEYMGIVISETDKLAALSMAMLDLCRLDSTTLIEKKDTFSPAKQIRSVIVASQMKWEKKHITIEPELDEFEIRSNENLVFRIWQNLIGNAIKFTNENGKIKISLKKFDNRLTFTVKDDGIGISEENKDKVFNVFFTGDKSHNT